MIVRITPRAERDLEEIIGYAKAFSSQGARHVALSLQQAFRVLGEQPRSGVAARRREAFVKIGPGYLNKVFYHLGAESDDILHVRHSSRRPWIP